MITVSVCMIVKNEQAVLARCLDSLQPAADEIIIVDTGSVDATKEIAFQYTDRVYDFTWINDFAAARNFAFSKATKDYIYSADADEVLDEENLQKLLNLKRVLLPEIEMVQFLYTNQLAHNTTYNFASELRPKLYKRLREFVWEDPLHESVRREPVIYDSDIEIIHMPEKPHGIRDFELFRQTVRTQGKLSVKLRSMYARELFIAGEDKDFLDAEEYFKVLVETESSSDRLKEVLCVLARAAAAGSNLNSFFKAILKAMTLGDPASEICCEIGRYFEMEKDLLEAELWYYNAAYETQPVLDIRCGGTIPLEGLIRCSRELGEETKAEQYQCELERRNAENQI